MLSITDALLMSQLWARLLTEWEQLLWHSFGAIRLSF